jgi:hypothetical protein
MYEKVLRRLREKVRQRDYVVTTHADEEMYEDGITIWDVEEAVLAGEVVGRQRDRRLGDWKYVVHGRSKNGRALAVVARIGYNQRMIIITVYLVEA